MQNISINFQVPQCWHVLSDKQLHYVYQLITDDFATDEVKTLCLLQWSGTKVIGRQDNGSHLLKRGKIIFEVTPLALAELLPYHDWLASLQTAVDHVGVYAVNSTGKAGVVLVHSNVVYTSTLSASLGNVKGYSYMGNGADISSMGGLIAANDRSRFSNGVNISADNVPFD